MKELHLHNLIRYPLIAMSIALSIPLFLLIMSISLSFIRLAGGFLAVTALFITILLGILELIFIIATGGIYSWKLETKASVRRFLIVTSCQAFLAASAGFLRPISLYLALGREVFSLRDIWQPFDTWLVVGGLIGGFVLLLLAALTQKSIQSAGNQVSTGY